MSLDDELVSRELGWCGCGNPEDVDRWMLSLLTYCASKWETPHGLSDEGFALLSYVADDLGWTEHGGSVNFAWLTTAGEEALANLSRYDAKVGERNG